MKKMIRKLSVLFMAFVMTVGMIAPAAAYADEDEYVYGTVNMNYADFYYGELEGIEPSNETAIDAGAKDPVTEAGYREEGFYDAATFATPRGAIYEKKWQTWPGVYTEPVIDEYNNLVGGKILGVADVNVAVKKSVYEAAKAEPDSVIGKKAAEIKLLDDQSKAPLSYKVLNADGVYSKYVNLTEPVETALDGYLTTEFMGDDIWWEGKAMKHTKDQTILGGIIEYKKDPKNASEKPVVLGLKHDENMYSDTWIGWGMGPGNVGIYGGNETGWQRFSGISGKYLTKMSYILMEADGSVHYYNATSEEGLLNPYVPSGVVDESGKHPYSAGITNYEFTKDRIKIDMEISAPTRADGTPEAGYFLYSLNCPGGGLKVSGETPVYKTNPEKMPVYQESEWVNGKKTYHIEISRKYMDGDTEKYFGTGRYKYWFDIDPDYPKQEGDRPFTGVAAWKMLYTDETPNDIYMQDGKLIVNSELFTVKDYINNPYQQIEFYDESGKAVDIVTTGDANTNVNLFKGAKKLDGTPVKGLINEDGTINLDAMLYSSRTDRRTGVTTESLTPVFPNENISKYKIVLYSGGFPIVQGTVSDERKSQEVKITSGDISMTYGDAPKKVEAEAKTGLLFKSSNANVASVDAEGNVTATGAGTCKITVTASPTDEYKWAEDEISVTVDSAKQEITAPDTLVMKITDNPAPLNAEAKTELSYQSDKEAVATVDETGTVTPVAAGSCTITITAKGTSQYKEATRDVKVTVQKLTPAITAAKKLFSLKAKKLKKKAQTAAFKAKTTSGGKLTYFKKGVSKKKFAKKFTVNKKTGKITVKKGVKKGKYVVTVLVKSAAKGNYTAGSKKFKVTVKVK